MLNECLMVNEKLFDKVCRFLAVRAIYSNAATEIITRLFAVPDEAVQMLLYGFFLGVGIAEVDFVGEPLARGKVFHECEISMPVKTRFLLRNFFLLHKMAVGGGFEPPVVFRPHQFSKLAG